LYKVAVDGGAAVPLADLPVREAVWGEDDSILATEGGFAAAVWRIPASGGERTKVLDPPDELRDFRLLQTLPGGGHALVAVVPAPASFGRRFDARAATIEALSLSDGSRTTVVRGASAARYLSTGHLVYVSEGALFAVAFDPDVLETRGAHVPILDDVQFNASNGMTSLSFSREGTLVYRAGAGVALTTFLAPPVRIDWIDAAGRRSPLGARAGRFERPRFSPDGTRLALLINDENGRDEWVLDLRRDSLNKITFGNLAITTPAWTPDGRDVIFGSGSRTIYWARADGAGEPQILLKTQGLNFVWSYSREAARLAYFDLFGRGGGIFTVPIAEGNGGLKAGTPEPFFETSSRVSTPEFSPDGRWIAYTTDETGRNEVQVRPFPPASGQGGKVTISTDGGENPRWSRTGNELLYQSGNRILSVHYTVTGDTFVPDRPRVRVDTLESADAWGWDLAPDGRIAVLTAVPVESEQALQLPPLEHTVMFLLNFFDELRRSVPVE
jgi:serine/threonine-protein kinase